MRPAGLDHLTPGVDWVLSGINAGGNLGADVYHSGTVAAVREGVLHGVPGIALSHYIAGGRVIDWPRAARWATAVLRRAAGDAAGHRRVLEREFPHPGPDDPDPEIVFCPLDPSPLPLTYRVEKGQATYSRQLPLPRPPAAQRRGRLLRRSDRRNLDPGVRRGVANRPELAGVRKSSFQEASTPRTSAQSPGEMSATPDFSTIANPSAMEHPRSWAIAAAAMHGERLMPAPQ